MQNWNYNQHSRSSTRDNSHASPQEKPFYSKRFKKSKTGEKEVIYNIFEGKGLKKRLLLNKILGKYLYRMEKNLKVTLIGKDDSGVEKVKSLLHICSERCWDLNYLLNED